MEREPRGGTEGVRVIHLSDSVADADGQQTKLDLVVEDQIARASVFRDGGLVLEVEVLEGDDGPVNRTLLHDVASRTTTLVVGRRVAGRTEVTVDGDLVDVGEQQRNVVDRSGPYLDRWVAMATRGIAAGPAYIPSEGGGDGRWNPNPGGGPKPGCNRCRALCAVKGAGWGAACAALRGPLAVTCAAGVAAQVVECRNDCDC
jgi:hypothetical protein